MRCGSRAAPGRAELRPLHRGWWCPQPQPPPPPVLHTHSAAGSGQPPQRSTGVQVWVASRRFLAAGGAYPPAALALGAHRRLNRRRKMPCLYRVRERWPLPAQAPVPPGSLKRTPPAQQPYHGSSCARDLARPCCCPPRRQLRPRLQVRRSTRTSTVQIHLVPPHVRCICAICPCPPPAARRTSPAVEPRCTPAIGSATWPCRPRDFRGRWPVEVRLRQQQARTTRRPAPSASALPAASWRTGLWLLSLEDVCVVPLCCCCCCCCEVNIRDKSSTMWQWRPGAVRAKGR